MPLCNKFFIRRSFEKIDENNLCEYIKYLNGLDSVVSK